MIINYGSKQKDFNLLMDISSFLARNGITTRGGKVIPSDQITHQILTNPFYYGHFKFLGEIHEGVHEPCVCWGKASRN